MSHNKPQIGAENPCGPIHLIYRFTFFDRSIFLSPDGLLVNLYDVLICLDVLYNKLNLNVKTKKCNAASGS